MPSKKQPYIPLYIGDWERKCNTLSLEAEAAWLKLTFKLWDSPTRGLLSFCFSQFVILCKKPPEKAREIWDELVKSGVFDLIESENDNYKIKSRRMSRELELSKVRSESGSKGGRPKKAKGNQTETKSKAKAKQIPDNDNDIDTDNENRNKGSAELKIVTKRPKKEIIFPFTSDEFKAKWNQWLEYKWEQWSFRYKSVHSEQGQLNELEDLSDGVESIALRIIQKSINNSWQGFFKLKNEDNKNGTTKNNGNLSPTGVRVDPQAEFGTV